ncbi:hypothetical protein POM88_045545 [Heracleum sosnowskyi]|uniref:Uncharacterized protein n=1 Tax=Heracleum sosnowskyi TaxID=360622 RepID=A0AAD8H642_9APIA|nr:hypothetical protein POM88_045545 [Heracleum sosnowskyi]
MADKRQTGKNVKHHRDTRIGGQAKMEISLKNGEWLNSTKGTTNLTSVEMNILDVDDLHRHVTIHDPSISTKHKRRPKIATRKKYGLELAAEVKNKKTCGLCNRKGHYRTGCHKYEV